MPAPGKAMLSKLRARVTYANVMSSIAVFVAVSTGGAYAANTVFSEDIADGEVKTADVGDQAVTERKLAPNAVTSPKVFDNNLTGDDIKGDSLTGADINEGSLVGGPGSPSGASGGDLTGSYPNPLIRSDAVGSSEILDNSLTGADIANYEVEVASQSIPAGGTTNEVEAECPAGKTVVSGGAFFGFPSGRLAGSYPSSGFSWKAFGQNQGNQSQNLTVIVFCH